MKTGKNFPYDEIINRLKPLGIKAEKEIAHKNNTDLDGLAIEISNGEENSVKAIMYPHLFPQPYDVDKIMLQILQYMQSNECQDAVMMQNIINSIMMNANADLEDLYWHSNLRIYRADWNKNLVQHAVVAPLWDTDLIKVVTYDIPTSGGNVRSLILQDNMSCLEHADRHELMKFAEQNALRDRQIYTPVDIIKKEMRAHGMPEEEIQRIEHDMLQQESIALRIISNQWNSYGAACGANRFTMEEIRGEYKEEFGTDKVLIIPKSIDELMTLPVSSSETDEILRCTAILSEGNKQNPHQSVLSDHLYVWDGKTMKNA